MLTYATATSTTAYRVNDNGTRGTFHFATKAEAVKWVRAQRRLGLQAGILHTPASTPDRCGPHCHSGVMGLGHAYCG